jgi:hypothetical protein
VRKANRDLFVFNRVTKMGLPGIGPGAGAVRPHVRLRVLTGYARLELTASLSDLKLDSVDPALIPDRERNNTMARKSRNPNFDQTLEILRTHGFEVSAFAGVAGGMLVAKHGAAAVLVPAQQVLPKDSPAAYYERPGAFVGGELARLVDRGYQKFIATPHFQLPATAPVLQAIHLFGEELNQLIGGISLYNEALGTTSDLYEYDRVKGREAPQPVEPASWALKQGH